MRQGENALAVIERVRQATLEATRRHRCPTASRSSGLHDRGRSSGARSTPCRHALVEEIVIVSLVILSCSCRHLPSALVPIVTIPVAVLLAFVPIHFAGLSSNIERRSPASRSPSACWSTARSSRWRTRTSGSRVGSGGRMGDFHEVRLARSEEVGPSVFFSLLVIAVAFLPIFTLVDQEGRLMAARVFEERSVMAIAALLAITLDPALHDLHAHGPWRSGRAGSARMFDVVDRVAIAPRSAPGQPRAVPRLRAGVPLRAAPSSADAARGGALRWSRPRCRSICGSATSSCRRSRARSSTCPTALPGACRSPRRNASSADPGTASCEELPGGRSACSARRDAPTRPPTRRRSRWSRRPSC